MFALSKRDKKFVAAGTVFLVLFSLVWFVYLPAVDKRAMLEKKVVSRARDIEQMQVLEMTSQQYAKSFDLEKKALEKRGPGFTLFSFLESLSSKSRITSYNVCYTKLLRLAMMRAIVVFPVPLGPASRRAWGTLFPEMALVRVVVT